MKFGFEIKNTLIWDNLNVKWNGFKNEYLKLKFETCWNIKNRMVWNVRSIIWNLFKWMILKWN